MFKDKVAIITGATKGIGKEILYRLAESGAIVYGIYSSSVELARNIEDEMESKGYNVLLIKGDVSDKEFVLNTVGTIAQRHSGRIDILINNAGITRDNIIMNMDEEDWNNVLDVNYGGTYNFCMYTVPLMVKKKSGSVVNIVSITGVLGREAQSNYGTSKGAVMGLSRLLSRKYSCEGVRVNCVAPGMIETEMISNVPTAKLENFLRFTSMKRLGQNKEVADVALYLASDKASYLSSTVIQLDGGFCR